MKKIIVISFLILHCVFANAQDSCLPKYSLPVKTIQLSTGKLAYTETGKGQTILFIHGIGGNMSHWLKVVNALSSSYKCIAVDLPGYGWSDKLVKSTNNDRLQFYADALSEFLKLKKIKKVVIAGHSMGAQVATIMALQNKRVKKLVLVSAAGLETFTEKEGQLLTGATPPASFEKQNEVVIRNNFKLNFFEQPSDAEQLIQERLRIKYCPDAKLYFETVSAGIKGMLAHPVKDSLHFLKIPVLIVFGVNDALIPNPYLHPGMKTEELARQSAALIKNARVEMINNAGHMAPFEKPGELSQTIKNFLQ
jgi:pimeloyl-ACP methyl ester carboxylesterase